MDRHISSRQLMSLCFVAMLSPFFRMIPGVAAQTAGHAAWVSAALSIIPALALSLILRQFLSGFPKGTGLGEAILRSLGPIGGRALLLVWCMWLLFHCSFLACTGADRFIATIYPNTAPQLFVGIMLLICTLAATEEIAPLARASQVFRPLLLGVIILVMAFSLSDLELSFVLPIFRRDIGPLLSAVPLAAEAVSVVLVCAAFLSGSLKPEPMPGRRWPWLCGVTTLGVSVCLVTIGNLGAKQTAGEAYPFFILLRDLRLFTGVERVDALVVALWLLPDFLLISLELVILSDSLLRLLGAENTPGARGKTLCFCLLVTALISFTIAPQKDALHRWSNGFVPYIQLTWAYGVCPAVLLLSAIRKKF